MARSKNKNLKEIQLPIKFNPGTSKYEPELPLRKTRKKFKLKINWIKIIIFAIIISIIFWFIFYKIK